VTIKALTPADVKFLAVHCAATQPTADVGVKEIDRWHRDRGFLKIGYHFVIRRNGVVETGRSLNERGAHIEDHNHESIGICLVGGVNAQLKAEDNFTKAQKDALAALLRQLKAGPYPHAVVQGHRDFPGVAKACPSFDVKSWWAGLAA
jgi:N-acetylmuramoyl-L-alanine amidase